MKKKSKKGQELCASFYAAAKLKSSLSELKKQMLLFPNTKIVADGLTVRCAVGDAQVDLRSDSITYSYCFDTAGKRNKGVNLVKFLSILAYLKSSYEVRIDSLYTQILEMMEDSLLLLHDGAGSDGNHADAERIKALSESNNVLSNELLSLNKKMAELKRREEVLRRFSTAVLEKLSSGASKESVKAALGKIGIGEQLSAGLMEILW